MTNFEIKPKRRKPLVQVIVALCLTAAVLAGFGVVKYLQIAAAIADGALHQPPPEAVTSYRAKYDEWPRTVEAIGSISAVQGAVLGAEAIGRVARINFESGAYVNAGDVLAELDVTIEEAQLKGALAQVEWSKLTLERARELRAKSANSQQDLDEAELKYRNATAAVDTLRAQISQKKVVAPFPGQTGIRQVNVGQIVLPGVPIVALQSYHPLFVDFSLPQEHLSKLQVGQKILVKVDAFPAMSFEARLNAVNSQVNATTRNVDVQGTVANEGNLLRPGMFARVTLIFPEVDRFITIPQSSINFAPYGNTVYVLAPGKDQQGRNATIAVPHFVKLGERRGDQIAVLSGLDEGAEIASSGTFKLRPGAPVVINNSITPDNDPAPTPKDT